MGDDPLGGKGREGERVRASFEELWSRLAREAADAGVLAQAFESALNFIVAFSGSNVRALRAGCTASGLALGRGLVRAALRAASARDTAARQAAAEARKGGAAAAAAKKAADGAHAAVTAAEDALGQVFTHLFTHRFRDADPAVRAACISSLGGWAAAHPSYFLKDYYVKYLGWALNDKDAGVRAASVAALRELYATPERAAMLDSFSTRFGPRLAAMARGDVDESVAAAAVGLLGAAHAAGAMNQDAIAPVVAALLDDAPAVRAAAAACVPALLAAAAEEEDATAAAAPKSGKAAKEAASARDLRGVLRILSAGPERAGAAACVVDALWPHLPALQDWSALASLAGGDDEDDASPAEERGVTDAVRLLAAGARKLAAEAAAPGGTKAAKDARATSRRSLTEALMSALPALLRRHGAHAQRAGELADCVRCMATEMYALKRQEKAFATLLALLRDAFFKQTEAAPLAACAASLAFAASGGAEALRDAGAAALADTLAQLAARLRKLAPPPGAAARRAAGGDAFELELALRRLRALQEAGCDARQAGLGPCLDAVLAPRPTAATEGAQALAASNATLLLLWGVAALAAAPEADGADGDADALAEERDALVTHLAALHRGAPSAKLKRTTFALLADVAWCCAAPALRAASAPAVLRRVGFTPPADLLADMWSACVRALPPGAAAASQPAASQLLADEEEEEAARRSAPADDLSAEAMMACAARLVLFELLPPERSAWLSGEIMALWCGHGAAAAELAKRVAAHARRTSASGYCRVALAALQSSYARHAADEHSAESGAALRDLGARLAASFGGGAVPAAARPLLAKLARAGLDWALEDAPGRLPFLPALQPFTAKLTADDRRAQLKAAESGAEAADAVEDDDDWAPLFAYITHLSERAAVAPPGSASAGKRSRSGTRRSGKRRRLAFASGEEEEGSEDDESDDDAVSDEDDEPAPRRVQPPPPRRAPPAGTVMPILDTRPTKRMASPPPRPVEESDDDESDDDVVRCCIAARRLLACLVADACLLLCLQEEADEEEEEAPAPRAAVKRARPQRAPLLLDDDDEEAGGAGAESDSDEELPAAPVGKKARH
jgi:cohesin complex subunit SA-1/2